MKLLLYIVCIATLCPYQALARPVSYPGGITLMQMNNMYSNNIHAHYSPSAKYSVGYKGEYWRDEKWQFHGIQLNNLIKRWNKPASQANIYIKSGLGVVQSRDHKNNLAAFTGISLDWENRSYFTSYENRFYEPGDVDHFFMQKARIGIAPYIGDYGDLHTWLMLQVDHSPENQDTITVTPLIRLFKGEYLTEIGVSDNGDALINFVVRY